MKDHVHLRIGPEIYYYPDAYGEKFFTNQTIVVNTSKSQVNRSYIDSQVNKANIPLIDTAIMGCQGYVQVVNQETTKLEKINSVDSKS